MPGPGNTGLNERGGGVQARHNELPGDGVDVSLDLAGDAELVAVEGNALQVGQQVVLGGRLGAGVSNAPTQRVQPVGTKQVFGGALS